MRYRTVPKNGDKLSALGFGGMRFVEKGNKIVFDLARRQLQSAIDRGVNYVDTGYFYQHQQSEPVIGRILSENGYRDKVKVATKLPHWITGSVADMNKVLDEQLKRLRTDHIDYYLIHALDGATWEIAKKDGVIEFLDGALGSGKIISAGFSYHGSSNDFEKVIDDYDWTFCQIQYNYLDTKTQAGTDGMKYAASKDMAVIVMEPLRGGNLAKDPPKEVQEIWNRSLNKRSPVDWALRWLLNQPEVTVILSGMNDVKQIAENIKIVSEVKPNSLSDEDIALVEESAAAYRSLMKAACTGCQYCMPCPAGVDIPSCLLHYNSYKMFKDNHQKFYYMAFNAGLTGGKPSFASQCTECGACLKKCPQGLPIPDLLKDVRREMEGFWYRPVMWVVRTLMMFNKKRR